LLERSLCISSRSANRRFPGTGAQQAKEAEGEVSGPTFVAMKCRVTPEPDPFILELKVNAEPWTYADVTP
jgi:hypothetical protein